jgi:SAM-dependent methyltransferase
VDFFRGDYLNVYGHTFSEERAEKESTFVASALELKPGASVLDLCCGQGRHSIQLAKRGLRVTGLDLNPEYLELAKRAAKASKVTIETIAADMRRIPFEDKFDAIVNMYSSFGYLESEGEDLKVLESAAKALKAGGRILLDMLNFVRRAARPGPRDQPHARAFHRGGPEGKPPRVDRTYHPALYVDRDDAAAGGRGAASDGGVRGIRWRGVRDRYAADDHHGAQVGASRAVIGGKAA